MARAETPKPNPGRAKPILQTAAAGAPAARAAAKAASIEDIIADAERDSAAEIDDITPPVRARARTEAASGQIATGVGRQERIVGARARTRRNRAWLPPLRVAPDTPGRALPSIVARAARLRAPGTVDVSVVAEPSRADRTSSPRRIRAALPPLPARQPMAFEMPDDLEAMSSARSGRPARAGPAGRDRSRHRGRSRPEARSPQQWLCRCRDRRDEPPPQWPVERAQCRRSGAAAQRARGAQFASRKEFATPRRSSTRAFPDGMPRAQSERRGFSAVTIFVVIFAVLLLGVGGAGFWAWQEGLNLDAMFGKGTGSGRGDQAGRGDAGFDRTRQYRDRRRDHRQLDQLKADRLPTVDTASSTAEATSAAGASTRRAKLKNGWAPTRRLRREYGRAGGGRCRSGGAAGSQSLLLEAADNGQTGATPFSGNGGLEQGRRRLASRRWWARRRFRRATLCRYPDPQERRSEPAA